MLVRDNASFFALFSACWACKDMYGRCQGAAMPMARIGNEIPSKSLASTYANHTLGSRGTSSDSGKYWGFATGSRIFLNCTFRTGLYAPFSFRRSWLSGSDICNHNMYGRCMRCDHRVIRCQMFKAKTPGVHGA